MSKPLNCWEFKKCGREPGGEKAVELGVCPASTEKSLDGMHRGDNAGRSCWVIAGTFCGGEVHGTYAATIEDCVECDFLKKVMEEEKTDHQSANDLLTAMRIVAR
jgi:hypothetical protein